MEDRGNWGSRYEFVLACVGSIVGLGNVWRFPYVCYKNGGGAFLIPYTILLLICGIPSAFLKMSYCQFANLSPARAWICVPLFQGIGYGIAAGTAILSIYYNVIIAWSLYYLAYSFKAILPWSKCDNSWNTNFCYLRMLDNTTGGERFVVDDTRMRNGTAVLNVTALNVSSNVTLLPRIRRTSTEEFWDHNVLQRSSGIEALGTVRWPLFLCLFVAWLVVFLVMIRGVKSSGKVMYVTATLPYLLLLILLCRAATLDGALDGLKFFIIPKWDKLFTLSVWCEAAVQLYFSSGIGGASIGTLASYNKFNRDISKFAAIMPIVDMASSVFAGFVMFLTLGYMANQTGLSIDSVVSQGPGLAFMVYPEILSRLPLSQLWSVVFFLMLFTVGIDSQIVYLHVLTSALIDNFPAIFKSKESWLTAILCVLGLILGIPCITQGGIYIVQMTDRYLPTFAALTLAFLEIIGLAWIYGIDKLYEDIGLMLHRNISRFWGIFWKYITPLVVLAICVFNLSNLKPINYGNIVFPTWATVVGVAISLIPLTIFITTLVMQIKKAKGHGLMERLRNAVHPHKDWGPADERLKDMYTQRTCIDNKTEKAEI